MTKFHSIEEWCSLLRGFTKDEEGQRQHLQYKIYKRTHPQSETEPIQETITDLRTTIRCERNSHLSGSHETRTKRNITIYLDLKKQEPRDDTHLGNTRGQQKSSITKKGIAEERPIGEKKLWANSCCIHQELQHNLSRVYKKWNSPSVRHAEDECGLCWIKL